MATIKDLHQDKSNPRKHGERNLKVIADSLRDYGFARSIVIDEDNNILAGNGVTQAAALAGMENVIEVEADGNSIIAVRRRGPTEEQKKKLKFARSIIGELSSCSSEQLLADLNAGLSFDGIFDQAELDALLAGLVEPEPVTDPGADISKADELQKKWQCQIGQVWQIGAHRLGVGDCTGKATVERLMQGEKAALVVTDPPYGVEYADKNKFLNSISRGNRIQTNIKGGHGNKADIQAMWKSAFSEMSAVMRPGAVVYCFMPQGGDQMMMMMMMMGAGIEPRHELIWLKNNHVLGRVDYAYKHASILYAWKKGGHHFYGDFQTSIIECKKPQKSDMHPTTKPVELIEVLIKNSSLTDEIVYDPFAGSGTTGMACAMNSRQARMVEIHQPYASVILERLSVATGLMPTLLEA